MSIKLSDYMQRITAFVKRTFGNAPVDYSTWHTHENKPPLQTQALFPPEVVVGTDRIVRIRNTTKEFASTYDVGIPLGGEIDWSARPIGATHVVIVTNSRMCMTRTYWLIWTGTNWNGDIWEGYIWKLRDPQSKNLMRIWHHSISIQNNIRQGSWESLQVVPFPAITHVACLLAGNLFSAKRPNRHADLRNTMEANGHTLDYRPNYGFVHPITGEFMSRREAMLHALAIGQLRKGDFWDADGYFNLHSEDLWQRDRGL